VDYPRFVFDGPIILLKLHIDRVYTLQDIAIFIFRLFGLKLPIHGPYGGDFSGILAPRYNEEQNSQNRNIIWEEAPAERTEMKICTRGRYHVRCSTVRQIQI